MLFQTTLSITKVWSIILQWRIQDFPDGDRPTIEERVPNYYFAFFFVENCSKLKETVPRCVCVWVGGWGGAEEECEHP